MAVIGLADLPRQHAQVRYRFELSRTGHGLVTGVFGSGKTSTLIQVAADLAASYPPSDLHLYGIDAGAGSLSPLTVLPHVGAVVGVGDLERVTRLIERLTAEVSARRDALGAEGSSDFLRWRQTGAGHPWIVMLVDDYTAFREVAEQADTGRLLERFNALLQNGPAVGIHLVVACNSGVDLRVRETNLMQSRLVLRSADPEDYALVDARFPPAGLPVLPPGRGLGHGAVQVQVCGVDDGRLTGIAGTWASTASDQSGGPLPVRRLPVRVPRSELPASDRADDLVLGVGGREVGTVSLRLDPRSPALLVAGPRQSGRSSTLLSLLVAVLDSKGNTDSDGGGRVPILVLAPRPSPLRGVADASMYPRFAAQGGLLFTDPSDLSQALERLDTQAAVILIDDAETIGGAPSLGDRLDGILRRASETGTTVIVGARVNDLPGMFDPWARYLLSLRRAVLLAPTVDDAFLMGIKLPQIPSSQLPGRGVLIEGSRVEVVQVATTEER